MPNCTHNQGDNPVAQTLSGEVCPPKVSGAPLPKLRGHSPHPKVSTPTFSDSNPLCQKGPQTALQAPCPPSRCPAPPKGLAARYSGLTTPLRGYLYRPVSIIREAVGTTLTEGYDLSNTQGMHRGYRLADGRELWVYQHPMHMSISVIPIEDETAEGEELEVYCPYKERYLVPRVDWNTLSLIMGTGVVDLSAISPLCPVHHPSPPYRAITLQRDVFVHHQGWWREYKLSDGRELWVHQHPLRLIMGVYNFLTANLLDPEGDWEEVVYLRRWPEGREDWADISLIGASGVVDLSDVRSDSACSWELESLDAPPFPHPDDELLSFDWGDGALQREGDIFSAGEEYDEDYEFGLDGAQ